MKYLVGYFDILGTSAMTKQDQFSDAYMLDFSNAVGVAAIDHPALRFAVFSDSVVISSPVARAKEFITAVAEISSNWFADFIFVRGGVALGDIRWVDFKRDDLFRRPNYSHSRVYGKALVEAYELERHSGPGMLYFVSEDAAQLFAKKIPGSIFSSLCPILVWMSEDSLGKLVKIFNLLLRDKNLCKEARRHYLATFRLFEQIQIRHFQRLDSLG